MKARSSTVLVLIIALGCFTASFSQTLIRGRVVDSDSNAVPFATVRLPGLSTTTQVNQQGYFEFHIAPKIIKDYYLKSGVDLFITVEKVSMVMLEPPDQKIRLPHNPDIQPQFRIIMVKKGSPLLVRSERMLEYVFQRRLTATIAAKDKELTRQYELAQEAVRLGLPEEALRVAVENYKRNLRTNPDLNKQGLAALDDANTASEYRTREQKLEVAEMAFREASKENAHAIEEGRKAEALQAEIDFNLGMVFFERARYDSAVINFAKADSAIPGKANQLNMLARALQELAQYDKSWQVFQLALEIDTNTHGRNQPNAAVLLNNIAGVLYARGDYVGALEKYNEALRILERTIGRVHPRAATVLNNIALMLKERCDYAGAMEMYNEALKINEASFGRNHPNVARDLNNIAGLLYVRGDYAGATEMYDEALHIMERKFGRVHPDVATVLNNFALMLREKGDYVGALKMVRV